MAERRRSPPHHQKFRRHHPHAHVHSHNHPQQHQPPQQQQHLDPGSGSGTDVTIRLNGPKGSNDLFIVDVFDGGVTGKEGHTSVAIYSTNPAGTLLPSPQLAKRRPRSKPESDNISQTGGPQDPADSFIFKSKEWGADDVDTQEVANDTLDLLRIMPGAPFLLNFSHYDGKDIALHVGLRKNRNRLNSKVVNPPCTDDYNRELFRYLKTQAHLKTLKFILEIHADDDILNYKVFDDEGVPHTTGEPRLFPESDFPVILSNLASFWSAKTITTELTFVHVELPGLCELYLNDWKRFLELQTQLVTCICNFGAVLWTFYSKTVTNNEKTLEKVVLRRVISYDLRNKGQLPLDFGNFQNCLQLKYLKITGGGYKDRWGEWSLIGNEQSPEEILLHVNFDLIPLENLLEFHFCRMNIQKKRLQELAIACQGKKLQLICCDCPDREYTDGDWPTNPLMDTDSDWEESTNQSVELAIQFGGHASSRRHDEYYKRQQEHKKYLIMFLTILCIIGFLGMTVAVSIAIAYSNK